MQQIFSAVRDTFVVEENAEITVEMNPGTVDREKLSGYKNLQIQRWAKAHLAHQPVGILKL